jgi:hypothetical protein
MSTQTMLAVQALKAGGHLPAPKLQFRNRRVGRCAFGCMLAEFAAATRSRVMAF